MRAYWGRLTKGNYVDETAETKIAIEHAYDNLFTNPPPYVALDTETPSLKNQRVMGIGIATPQDDNFYFDFTEATIPWHLIMPSPVRKIWHNATFDLSKEVLGRYSVDIDNIEDTAIMTRMLNIDVTLELAALHTNARTQSVSNLLKEYNVRSMADLPWLEVALKCINDVRVTLQLYEKYRHIVNQENYEVERKITSMLLHMSHRGIQLDKELVSAIESEMASGASHYSRVLPFNYNSPVQVARALGEAKIFLPQVRDHKTKMIKHPTGRAVLETFDHILPMTILEARKYTKLHSVVKGLVGLDRAYSHFHLDSATRRITSENIQMHNLPTAHRETDIHPKAGPVRRILVPDSGLWTRFDLSQLELRVLDRYCGDPVMHRALITPKGAGPDIHSTTQLALNLGSRTIAKNFNFGSIYGGDIPILSSFTGIKDRDLLRGYQQQYFSTYPVMKNWIDNQRYRGLRDGFVTTLYGQELSLDIAMRSGERHAGNCAINYPIQGSATEIFKRIIIAILETVPMDKFVLQVHDEQLLEGPHALRADLLAWIAGFWTPLETSIISRWQ